MQDASDFRQFEFDLTMLATPRKPGISAYMKIKNEQQFLRLCIESHLPFYDEIICVYNDCTDNTESILYDLQKKYPQKIKVFHYLPKVYWVTTPEHATISTESIHSVANYCNYAIAQCRYSVATKLDADHLAIAKNLKPLIQTIRADIEAGKQKIYYFSGINLIQKDGEVCCGGEAHIPFSGNHDIFYHPVCPQVYFAQRPGHERYNIPRSLKIEYMGIMYFHLNRLKTERLKTHSYREGAGLHAVPFAEFISDKNIKRMLRLLSFKNRLRYFIFKMPFMRALKYRLFGTYVNFRPMRLLRLKQDLSGIDFQRDVVDKLP